MRVLLADDEPQVRSALRLLLEQQPDLDVAGEAGERQALLTTLPAARADLVLLDWELPGGPPADLVVAMRRVDAELRILALSCRPEARGAALAAGANGFASKCDPPEVMLAALRRTTAPDRRQE